MIVNRRTFVAKKGCSDKVVKLLRTITNGFAKPEVVRIYQSFVSPNDQVVWEGEFENLEEYAKFSAEWTGSKKRAAKLKSFDELMESGGSSEIWYLY